MKPKSISQGAKSQQGSWSWLDRVQTRLESLYETEQGGSVFLQETGRMLESQVTKVGTNVKKFYSDFMRELLLPLEVPGESQAWADAQARLKTPALAGAEQVPEEDQPSTGAEGETAAGEELPGADEQLKESGMQAEPNAMAASVSSDSGDFEVLAPPLFQAPPVEETHEDLRVKERVTKLHLKLQEMQRIESAAPTVVIADVRSTEEPPIDPAVREAVQRTVQNAVQTPVQTPVPHPVQTPHPFPSVEPAGIPPTADPSADSDAADLEFASETEGDTGKKDEEDFLSGNESDLSQNAKWYGARGVLLRVGSGEATGERGGWFDWELV